MNHRARRSTIGLLAALLLALGPGSMDGARAAEVELPAELAGAASAKDFSSTTALLDRDGLKLELGQVRAYAGGTMDAWLATSVQGAVAADKGNAYTRIDDLTIDRTGTPGAEIDGVQLVAAARCDADGCKVRLLGAGQLDEPVAQALRKGTKALIVSKKDQLGKDVDGAWFVRIPLRLTVKNTP